MGSAKYTDDYRRETADYIISTGRPVAVVARELEMSEKAESDPFSLTGCNAVFAASSDILAS